MSTIVRCMEGRIFCKNLDLAFKKPNLKPP